METMDVNASNIICVSAGFGEGETNDMHANEQEIDVEDVKW